VAGPFFFPAIRIASGRKCARNSISGERARLTAGLAWPGRRPAAM